MLVENGQRGDDPDIIEISIHKDQTQGLVQKDEKVTRAKHIYSQAIRKEVTQKLKEMSIQEVFLLYMGEIPRTTLYTWRKGIKFPKKKGKQGRKTPFTILEEELLVWFLTLRARRLCVTNSKLQKKALRIKEKIIEDEVMPEGTKKIYRAFTASDGWVQNFRTRHCLVRRGITTKCDKTVEEIRASLKQYFTELQDNIDTHSPA